MSTAKLTLASIAPPKLTLDSPLMSGSYSYTYTPGPANYAFDPSPVERVGDYALPESNLGSHEDRPPVTTFFRAPSLTVDTRLIQSCPASLHSSPVFASAQPVFSSWQSPQSWESTAASAGSPLEWDQNWLPTPMGSPHAAPQGIHSILEPQPQQQQQQIPTVDPSWVTLPPWNTGPMAYASPPATSNAHCMCGACEQCQRSRPLSSIWEGENEECAKKPTSTVPDLAAVHE